MEEDEKQTNSDSNTDKDIVKETESATTEPTTDGNDPETDKIVDEIVAKEGDDLLEAEDIKVAASEVSEQVSFGTRVKNFFIGWVHSSLARWMTFLVVLILIGLAAALPQSRYYILNVAGVSGSASLTVLDDSTQEPLKNVRVNLAGQIGQTDKQGNVSLAGLKLGKTELVIEKRAFAKLSRKLTIGWGSNPLGDFRIKPSGAQYTINVSDLLSGKPIAKAEASSEEASALSDTKGVIKLTIEQPSDQVRVTVKAEGYRDEIIKFGSSTKATQTVKSVPSSKHVFVSKRTGKFDVYSVDIDGKNEKKILAGTGNERDDIVIAENSINNLVAVVSSRDSQKDKDGFLLSTLTLVNLADDTTYKIAQSERIQIVDWANARLVYIQIAAGASADNPRRYRLMTYDPKQRISKEIASSNYFNDVVSAQNKIYYAPSSIYIGGSNVGFYSVNGDGTNKQTVKSDEVWNAFRSAYDHIILSVDQQWFDYKIGVGLTKLNESPANLANRVYIDSPDGKHSLWVDNRDGKGALISYDITAKQDKTILSPDGIKYPIEWINNSTVVYRVANDQETADYVISLDGGQSRKIGDVTDTGGIDKWYYY